MLERYLQSQYFSSEHGRADLHLPTWVDESLTIIKTGYFQDGLVVECIPKHNSMPEEEVLVPFVHFF